MTDFASIGIQLDSRPVAEGTKALDALGASAAAMEPKVDSATKAAGALVEASANVWRRGGDATKAVDALGESSNRTGQKITVSNGQMADTAKILQAQAEQAKAAAAGNATLGASTNQLTLGQQQLIEKFREQAATIGMSRSQLMAYQAAQMGLTTQTQQAITAVKAHEDAIKAAAKAKEDAAKSANQLNDALKLLASGYAMLKIGEYIKDSALLAARYETLGVVMEVVGRNAGYTKTQMDAASEGIARQGITMIESRESAVKLVQAHVDLRYAEGLARIAQNAAVIGHMNSSEAFDRLVNGIARGNVLILRNIGINVNLQSAYREMADTLGKTTKELTENERVEARRIAVFERGADINDVYTKSMDTAGKQILSMQRYTQDFKTTFGETFNEVLTISVMALTDHLKDSNKAITDLSKNNQLEEWGHNLTSIFVTLANQVGNAYTTFQKFDTFARHMDAKKAINEDFDAQSKANSDAGAPWGDKAIYEREQKIEARRKAALAQENVDYVTHQAELSGNFDRFARAAAEREAARTAKHKAEADARLKVDADYAKAATDILLKSANEGAAAQAAAGKKVLALYNATYVGTPNYRDTDGRPPKEKVDQAENTRMADHMKRLETEAAAEKASAEFMIRIDEMRHKAGEMGDQEFYARRRGFADEIAGAEISSYNKQLDALKKHHNNTEAEAASNAKAIHDIDDKLAAAKDKHAYDDLERDEEERLRKRAIAMASDDMVNKYMSSLEKEAQKIEDANTRHEQSASAVQREEIARLDLSIAAQRQFMAEQLVNGATAEELAQSPAVLKFLEDQRALRERIATGLDTSEIDKANKRASDEASRAWRHTANTIENDLTNAILDGGGRGWKKLARDMEVAFARMVLSPILQPISAGIASMVNPMAPQAGGSAVGSATGSLFGSALGGASLFGAGGLAGSMAAGAGWLTGATTLGGSLSAAGSLAATGTLGGIASSLGMAVGALGPIALGIGAAVAIWKKFDTGGTEHTGGAASASSAGVSAIDSSPIGFHLPQRSAEADKMTAALAGGIVNILDSTALAFGKTAGYTAATAFADDSSKDGAWGALLINKLGEKVVNWQDTQTSRWAPKEFSDGAAGQAEYLAALSTSVRTALNGIGLPEWAKSMLDGLGAGAGIEDIAKVVDSINATQRALVIMGNSLTGFAQLGDKATSALIAASGGIDALASNASSYYDNFYRDGEKSAGTVKQISDALAAVNIAMPATRDGYRAQVEAQMALGEAGAPAVATMLKWSGAFAQVVPQLEAAADAAKSAADILSERNDLQKQLDQLTMSSTQLLTKQRNALDASNRGLFDQLQAAQKLKDAQDAAKTSLGDTITKMKSFADATKAYGSGLVTGSLSTLTPMQQYAEMRKQLDANIAASKKGDTAAQGNYQSLATAFLTASQKINGGDSQYSSDFAGVLQTTDEMAKWAAGQVDVAQASLDALNAQVIGISDLNTSMQDVAQAVADLPAAFAAAPSVVMPAPVSYFSTLGTANTEALVAEVKALREEVKGLRADQQKQTGDSIGVAAQVQQDAAQTIVDGVGGAIARAASAANKSFELE